MTPATEHDTLYALALREYQYYYPPWLRDDSRERVVANIAADMGIAGCNATFGVRKSVAREVIEKERV